jgi:GLPGLI family protein
MKKVIFIFLLVFAVKLQSQNSIEEKGFISTGEIEYIMYVKFKNPDPYLAKLIFNTSNAVYDYKGSTKGENTIDKGNNKMTYIKDTTSYKLLLSKKSNMLYEKSKRGYYVYEKIPELKWILLKETKVFKEIKCSKAFTWFRGRKYYAWYASSISSSFGPWKLNGLPGLILEAYDESENVYFKFKSLKIPMEVSVNFINPDLKRKKLSIAIKERDKRVKKALEAIRSRDVRKGITSKISGGETIELTYDDLKEND